MVLSYLKPFRRVNSIKEQISPKAKVDISTFGGAATRSNFSPNVEAKINSWIYMMTADNQIYGYPIAYMLINLLYLLIKIKLFCRLF